MFVTLPLHSSETPRLLFSRLGYHPERGSGGQESYGRRVSVGQFPRFHIYIHHAASGEISFRIHLDQKRPSYAGSHAHGGEYEGRVLETEVARLRNTGSR